MKHTCKKLLALMLALTFALALFGCGGEEEESAEIITEPGSSEQAETDANGQPVPTQPADDRIFNPLTGEAGYSAEALAQKAVAIVVENHPAARPQWGMNSPDIIMEYEVEGGISRMLWIYADSSTVPEYVGPVRSARHDIVELARGWDLVFVHCGGSTEGLALISTYGSALSDFDVMTHSACTYRASTRDVALEHRLVLVGSKLRTELVNYGVDTEADPEKRTPLSFTKPEAPRTLAGGESQGVHFEYSGAYTYDFTYDAAAGTYLRAINGKPMTDEFSVNCVYDNVIVLYVDMQSRNDSSGHQDLLLENGGSGLYFCGGRYEEIKWEKGEGADPLKLLTSDGEPLTLNPGRSYIGFVRSTQAGKTSY
ncbi:MAG: DUF3048 domain-containing protein [Clostridia bacterium]|nr:DUF3048 domain-containing protein [Clostridia bacterium]